MNMDAAIFSFVKTYENSVIASVKLTRFLAQVLELPIYEKGGASIPDGLDVLIIVNGAYAFAGNDTLAMLGRAIETARRVVWVQQDYTVIPPKDEGNAESPFRKAFRNRLAVGAPSVDYWTTCESYAKAGRAPTGHICGPGSRYMNWNVLTFDPDLRTIPMSDRVNHDSMIYYGSYRVINSANRKDRAPYFRRYLAEPHVKTTISCPTTKFIEAGYVHENIRHLDRFDVRLDLPHYGLGLYLEDQMSHKEYHSPANRFYEMLSAGVGMVFQPEACRFLKHRAGLEVDDFTLWNAEEASGKMADRDAIAARQHDMWWARCVEERSSLVQRTREMYLDYARQLA
jgi:hypothetical protein